MSWQDLQTDPFHDWSCKAYALPTRLQAIVLQDQRSIGRLVNPQVEVQPASCSGAVSSELPALPLQVLKLVYDCWQPVSRSLAGDTVPSDIRIGINDALAGSSISLKVIGKYQGTSFVYPVTHSVSGRDLAAAVSLHLQQLDYIEQQRARHQSQKTDGASHQRVPRHHFTVQIGEQLAWFPIANIPAASSKRYC
jgi:hypothetical protein